MPVTNAAGLALTKSFEGCVLFAYDDAVWPSTPFMPGMTLQGTLTIGYGHTGTDVHPGMRITQAEATALLQNDLQRFEIAVNNMVTHDLTSNQFSALVDFAFNEGASALKSSTLMTDVNAGDLAGAAAQFAVWDIGNGQVLEDLVKRRAAERALFETPD